MDKIYFYYVKMLSVDKKKMSFFYDSFNIVIKLVKLIDKLVIINLDNFFLKRICMVLYL